MKRVACPRCGQAAILSPDNPWRPFCSERCRTIDLGKWAAEEYRVPEASAPREGETPGESSGEDSVTRT